MYKTVCVDVYTYLAINVAALLPLYVSDDTRHLTSTKVRGHTVVCDTTSSTTVRDSGISMVTNQTGCSFYQFFRRAKKILNFIMLPHIFFHVQT